MLHLSANHIKDFQLCERLYDYRYNDKLLKTEVLDTRRKKRKEFEETIKKVASFFFFRKQALAEPSYQSLLNRWQKNWFSSEVDATYIATLTHSMSSQTETSYTTQAAMALMHLYEDFGERQDIEVVLCSEDFAVPLNKKVALTGTFDLVTRQKVNNEYVYVIYKWIGEGIRYLPGFWDIDFAILSYAFKYRNDFKPLNVEYRIWDFATSKPGMLKVTPNPEDFEVMKQWIEDLMTTTVFKSRRGLTPYCKVCPYDLICSKWKVNPSDN